MAGVARGRDAADVADVHADEVDQPFGDEGLPLAWVDEQLAHRQPRRALAADHAEPVDVLRGQRVLQEEQVERLDILGEPHCIDGLQPFVDVVQQLDLIAHRAADVLDHASACCGM